MEQSPEKMDGSKQNESELVAKEMNSSVGNAEKKEEDGKKEEVDAKSDRSDNIYGLVELLTDTDYKEIQFEHNGFS